jgi:sigma-B regulation protein RsbU (phosphoserine phosphatase)
MFRLDTAGMPVGISEEATFESAPFRFEVDDVLVAYTDGITEAQNPDGQQWGQKRLEKLLQSCSRTTPQQIIDIILDEVTTFASGQPQQDDTTLVVMGVQEGCDV